MSLKEKNPHENDLRIKFDEGPHIYYVDGKKIDTSVTTFVHDCFPKFKGDEIAKKIYNNQYNKKGAKYYNMSIDDILGSWETNRIRSSSDGTSLHKAIEDYYNGNSKLIPDKILNSIEWQYFQNFIENNEDLVPYRSEWEVFYDEYSLAGSIDMVFKTIEGKYKIYDWKHSKEIKLKNDFENALEPIEHLPNSNYWLYSLQLNTYKRILEEKYSIEIESMHLIILHSGNNNYVHYEVPLLSDEIDSIFSRRKRIFLHTQQEQSDL